MAAKEPSRTIFTNTNKADLILPNGVVIAPDAEVALDAATVGNLGVRLWIEAGLLTAKQ